MRCAFWPSYCIVTFSDPLAQEFPDEAVEADTVVDPGATRVASPGLLLLNERIAVFPDVQVALLVTSLLLLSVAVNWTVGLVACVNGP
jgi:hypothetical protein